MMILRPQGLFGRKELFEILNEKFNWKKS
jgi:hypothetical protein